MNMEADGVALNLLCVCVCVCVGKTGKRDRREDRKKRQARTIIYFIHPSGKLKLSFDRTTKNIPERT